MTAMTDTERGPFCRYAHWFAYYGAPGSSSPVCVRHGCYAKNPNYDRQRDPERYNDPNGPWCQW